MIERKFFCAAAYISQVALNCRIFQSFQVCVKTNYSNWSDLFLYLESCMWGRGACETKFSGINYLRGDQKWPLHHEIWRIEGLLETFTLFLHTHTHGEYSHLFSYFNSQFFCGSVCLKGYIVIFLSVYCIKGTVLQDGIWLEVLSFDRSLLKGKTKRFFEDFSRPTPVRGFPICGLYVRVWDSHIGLIQACCCCFMAQQTSLCPNQSQSDTPGASPKARNILCACTHWQK